MSHLVLVCHLLLLALPLMVAHVHSPTLILTYTQNMQGRYFM